MTEINQLTPEWLTERLCANRHLQQGRVDQIRIVKAQHTSVSSVFHLHIHYTAATIGAPEKLFCKLPKPDFAWGDKEHEFYTPVAPAMAAGGGGEARPFPFCYDSVYEADSRRSHLLLADLGATHYALDAAMPPLELREALIDAYAAFHAFWWEHPQLGHGVGELLTDAAIDGFLATAQEKFGRFCHYAAAELTPAVERILAAVCTDWPLRRRRRLTAGVGVTLVHRDPHPRNFLFPRDPACHGVKLIDWQSWRVDTGADDLAYLMACHWPLADDPTLEGALLARYHAGLVERGVTGYTWEECRYDYQASILRCLFFLLLAWSPAQWEQGVWWPRVQLGLAAYRRWGCNETDSATIDG